MMFDPNNAPPSPFASDELLEEPPQLSEGDHRELAREFLQKMRLKKMQDSLAFQEKAHELNKKFFG